MMKDKLWTRSFLAVAGGNFLLFFAFYLLLPVLPMYLMEQFGSNKATVGVILSSYTITALFVRPFAGYMVDTFPRKPLQLICYGVFTLFFGGYLLAGTLLLFAVIRAMHGLAFGMVTVSNSTVAIDVMPSSRRGEVIWQWQWDLPYHYIYWMHSAIMIRYFYYPCFPVYWVSF